MISPYVTYKRTSKEKERIKKKIEEGKIQISNTSEEDKQRLEEILNSRKNGADNNPVVFYFSKTPNAANNPNVNPISLSYHPREDYHTK